MKKPNFAKEVADLLRRRLHPELATQPCGAHYFIRGGRVEWCG